MANPGYVRSTDGDNADDGSTWALANATLAGAMADHSAGDRIWVSDNHAESTAGAVTITAPGTLASPNQILCGDDAAEPPTALATSGTVASTGANSITLNGFSHWHGLAFSSGLSFIIASTAGCVQNYELCDFIIAGVTSTNVIQLGTAANQLASDVTWKDCDVKFANAVQNINLINANLTWRGGSLLSGGTSPTNLIELAGSGRGGICEISGIDLVNSSAGIFIFAGALGSFRCIARNCKLPASWSGDIYSGTPPVGGRAEMYNCSAGDVNYALKIKDYAGTIDHETTIVRTGGASDGTTPIAWKMVTATSAEYPHQVLRSPEIVRWNETTGSAVTVTVEIVHDSQGTGTSSAFTDKEIWLEVQYLGTSGFPLSLFVDDAAADILASAADQTSSSETWTTTGLTTPLKQKLSVTFTPQEKGFIHAVVCMAGASDTAYICPKLTIS